VKKLTLDQAIAIINKVQSTCGLGIQELMEQEANLQSDKLSAFYISAVKQYQLINFIIDEDVKKYERENEINQTPVGSFMRLESLINEVKEIVTANNAILIQINQPAATFELTEQPTLLNKLTSLFKKRN
jgi:hypothetical protein